MSPHSPSLIQRAARIGLLILDVDGVLTDGRICYDGHGDEIKAFHVRDGYGLKMLQQAGIRIALISGRPSRAVERRAAELGIEHVLLGRRDKLEAFRSLLRTLGVTPDTVACIGDDVPDLPILNEVGLSVAVADAHPEVAAGAYWQTTLDGGRGAVREVCDLLVTARAGSG